MSGRAWGAILIVVGLLGGLLAALADVIRVGLLPGQFGLVQVFGLIIGAALFIVGLVMVTRRP